MRTFYIFKMTYLGCTWDMGWSLKQIQSEDNTKTTGCYLQGNKHFIQMQFQNNKLYYNILLLLLYDNENNRD